MAVEITIARYKTEVSASARYPTDCIRSIEENKAQAWSGRVDAGAEESIGQVEPLRRR
jgi:hypothetical protein